MIVDDSPANLKLLEDLLLQRGHGLRSFPRSRLALAAAIQNPPDLFLLDIDMPEMDGYELCRELKAIRELSLVPVIFLSALSETHSKMRAFQAGGVDYISKPFQLEEVHARVETHLKLHQFQRALKSHNELLEQSVADRTRELAEANQRLTILDRSKNEFLNLISHEFRTPLNGLLGVGEIIFGEMPSTPENLELWELFEQSRRRILNILDDALLLTHIDVSRETFRVAPVSLYGTLNRAAMAAAQSAAAREISFQMPVLGSDLVLGDEELLIRAFHALLETAVKFSKSGGSVQLSLMTASREQRVVIETKGRKVAPVSLSKFFEVFSGGQAITRGEDLGLGPAMASRILSLFGASVSVENQEPPGIRLTISLKRAAEYGDSASAHDRPTSLSSY